MTNMVCEESNAPWGPAQISSRTLGASSYSYDDTAGEGTFSYIVGMSLKSALAICMRDVVLTISDTGIRLTHNEFEGRAAWGFNAVSGSANTDSEGHGT